MGESVLPHPLPESDRAGTTNQPHHWVVEVHVDEDWYREQASPVPLPENRTVRRVALTGRALVGRASRARQSAPQVDLDDDLGVSRRQCELVWRSEGWSVRDLGSANGTRVRRFDQPNPGMPITREELLGDGDELYLGSWSRLVLRRAND